MQLRLAALVLGLVTGFVFGWARLTDPETFHRMLALRSADVYLLMGGAVAVIFVGARFLRGHRALVTREPIGWSSTRPTRSHLVGSTVFGVGWGVSAACPGPIAAQLGGGRVLTVALAAGVLVGVGLQPRLARAAERARRRTESPAQPVRAADVL
jgi:uncharacterized membrane protein YedE/YeeE